MPVARNRLFFDHILQLWPCNTHQGAYSSGTGPKKEIRKMKRFASFCLCVVVPLVWLGASANVVHAQQSVFVSPEVKADTLQRLELARTWSIPSSDDWINPTDWPKGNIKEARNLCNKGPHGSDDETQQAGCFNFLTWTKYDHITSASLDELMPVFKLCAVGGQQDCARAMEFLIKTGHPDYSLAIAEYASTCNGCVALWDFSVGSGGYQLDLTPGALYSDQVSLYAMVTQPGRAKGTYSIHVTSPGDVVNLLRICCLGNGSQLACQWYQQAGVAVSDSQREQAAVNQHATEDRAAAEKDQQFNRGQQHSQESAQAWNNVVGALNSATPTIQETAAQNQANLQAAAAAAQQRRQSQDQARLAAEQSARAAQAATANARPIPSDTNASSSPATSASAATPNTNNNPYTWTPPQGSNNPYTVAGPGSPAPQQYAATLNQCVREYYDRNNYNWLSYENTCSQAIYVVIVSKSGTNIGSFNLVPGQSGGPGLSFSEVTAKGGVEAYACPVNFVPVDSNDQRVNSQPVANYRCKKS
jgi:hypothetical protein